MTTTDTVGHGLRQALVISLLLVAAPITLAAGGGAGGMSSAPATSQRELTPEQMAAQAYKQGYRYKERAWKHEAKAADLAGKKRDKQLARAQKAYEKAGAHFSEALKHAPGSYEAANELGYTLRQLGDYRKAIGAYGYALRLKPDYMPAIEYRGEALLALGMFDDVKAAYMTLFTGDPDLAAQLMQKMTAWAAENGDTSDDHRAFVAWVEERRGLADMTRDLSLNNTRDW